MRAFVIRASDIDRCPIHALAAEHYFDDGACRCFPMSVRAAGDLQLLRWLSQPWGRIPRRVLDDEARRRNLL